MFAGKLDMRISSHHYPTNYPFRHVVDGKKVGNGYDNLVASITGHSAPWISINLESDYCILAVEIWNSNDIGKLVCGEAIVIGPDIIQYLGVDNS